ncbi:hypothetical protein [Caldimonas tepidiphila]|uniref:hypothetical protein n=1 Tax=Caldimonas tepidiphila TaxID=2315841 RepID=UPI000E5B34A0|nr:hypothetical protein [Caldimonas tepidiphila]
MPQLIQHIDAIARKKQRDVLYLMFPRKKDRPPQDVEDLPLRRQIIEWLEHEGIDWKPCGGIASETRMVPYRGQIYVDVPFDPSDPAYQKLQSYLEHPDGTMRFDEALFCALTLDVAMKNAHHDEPGFWERWADEF